MGGRSRRRCRTWHWIALACVPLASSAQFSGGENDGHDFAARIVSPCIPLATTDIFKGGENDGHHFAVLSSGTTCTPLATAGIFTGGPNDGHALFSQILTPIDCSTILPVELIYFTANCAADVVELEWKTASEVNNDFFTLYFSMDGINWQSVAQINGAGNTSHASTYNHTVRRFWQGELVYFQLTQTDFNGDTYIEGIRSVNCEINKINIFPNPNNGLFHIEGLPIGTTIQVRNSVGAQVHEEDVTDSFTTLDLQQLSPGFYSVAIYQPSEGIIHHEKVIISK